MSSVPSPVFHHHAGDYLSTEEWGALLRTDERVARALGPEPFSDARHLLAPLSPQDLPDIAPTAEGTQAVLPGADFVVDLRAERPRTVADIYPLFPPAIRARLDFPRLYVAVPGRDGRSERSLSLDDAPNTTRVLSVTLAWSLSDLVSIGDPPAATADLRRFLVEAGQIGISAGLTVVAQEDPAEAVRRASVLRSLLRKVGGTIEMRLLPFAGSFPSRDVWRAVHSLGLVWGSMDLFHWYGGTDYSLFRVLAHGTPAYFLPERAAEGERVAGLILEFDLPRSPAPLAIFDRMAIALAYLRGTLGGHPVTRSGQELDGDRLDNEREKLAKAIQAMIVSGIAPGSPTALRFF